VNLQEQLTNSLPVQRLEALLDSIRIATRARLAAEESIQGLSPAAEVVGDGAGDVTYGIDLESEEVVTRWFEECACEGPLSLFTEDLGWRHAGPGDGGWTELADFDHGGPRIIIDPIDGTRPLLGDLRSAWTSIAVCPPGQEEPRASDVTLGLLGELPHSMTESWRVIQAQRGVGATLERRSFAPTSEAVGASLVTDSDDRADHGVFSFFRFSPHQRPQIAAVEADFFARIAAGEGADLMHCYDDQYVCNVGQLVHLALGSYRLIADLRAHLSGPNDAPVVTSKPYDLAAAILVAREAGCVVTAPDGTPLDFPLDATTPVSFVGWANEPTARRLAPHLEAALS
jgi:fructose-1,6-bisphosphatase/inositol monophosphatase family enzyme